MIWFVPKQDITAASKQETSVITRELKHNRAQATGSITAELAKNGGRIMWDKIHTLMKRV